MLPPPVILAAALLLASAAEPATQPTTHPATQPAPRMQITGVEGIVQIRHADTEPWRRAQLGESLTATSTFRVGPRSAIRFTVGDEVFTYDRLGVTTVPRVIEYAKDPSKGRVGRTRYDLEATGMEHPPSSLRIQTGPTKTFDAHPFSPATQPATRPATQSSSFIEITSVEGIVQVREREGQLWRQAQVGDRLPLDGAFRTGPRSAVRFTHDDTTFTFDRLGAMTFERAIDDSRRVRTDLRMKYGRTRYDVEAAGTEHVGTIRSPQATLKIRGHPYDYYLPEGHPWKRVKSPSSLTTKATLPHWLDRIFTRLRQTKQATTRPAE